MRNTFLRFLPSSTSYALAALLVGAVSAYPQSQSGDPSAATNNAAVKTETGWPSASAQQAQVTPQEPNYPQPTDSPQAPENATMPPDGGYSQQAPGSSGPVNAPPPGPVSNGPGFGSYGPGNAAPMNGGYDPRQNQGGFQPASVPAQLTIRPGTYVTVRLNTPLSSDQNRPGDVFSATLVQPIVVNGVVVAQAGQLVNGRVADVQKAGRVEGTSRLAVQLTDLTLVDGQQMPIQSRLIGRAGSTSVGRDAAAIAGTTALGAAVGGAVGWGEGAAIGAGAGAVASTVGVLLTRGHPTILYPETPLTFSIDASVTISTIRAPQAFRYVDPVDYDQQPPVQQPLYSQAAPAAPAPYYNYAPAPYYAGAPYYGYPYYSAYPYYGYGYPYGYGPGISFFFGRGYSYGPRYSGAYRGGFYGGGLYRGPVGAYRGGSVYRGSVGGYRGGAGARGSHR